MTAICVRDARLLRTDLNTRMPFRYGIATVTRLPHVFVRLEVAVGGEKRVGMAADHLPPKWFTKDPARDPAGEIVEMERVVRSACDLAVGLGERETPFAWWRALYDAQFAWGDAHGLPPLLTNFGTSLVERAVLDAVARAANRPFHALLCEDALGIDLGAIHPELRGRRPADLLPAEPLASVVVRHTVGMLDPLTDAEITDENRLDDGLPHSLEASIRAYGLRHFKIKFGGDPVADAARLARIVDVLPDDAALSIDGNESYKSVESLRTLWESLPPFPQTLLFVEQPLHRAVALTPETGDALEAWPTRPPLIIDESDADLSSVPTALRRGYVGTSHKNCKGIFKGIANACLLAERRRSGRPGLLSGEDLSTIGPISLQQDLAVQAALGAESVERNGHHYFAGLSGFPVETQRAILDAHPDLFHASPRGWPTLTIEDGRLDLGSVNAAPFGSRFEID